MHRTQETVDLTTLRPRNKSVMYAGHHDRWNMKCTGHSRFFAGHLLFSSFDNYSEVTFLIIGENKEKKLQMLNYEVLYILVYTRIFRIWMVTNKTVVCHNISEPHSFNETKIHSCTHFSIKNLTGHACPVSDKIWRSNWKNFLSMTASYFEAWVYTAVSMCPELTQLIGLPFHRRQKTGSVRRLNKL
jgi:hypothetical protein